MNVLDFVPYLSIKNANEAVDFYRQVFECEPKQLLRMPDGRVMHCEFQIGGARLFLSEELPEHGGSPSPSTVNATTVSIHLYVADCDALLGRMRSNGAEVLAEPEDLFWGERFARVRDPFGHEWGIAQLVTKMSPEEIQAAAEKLFEQMSDD